MSEEMSSPKTAVVTGAAGAFGRWIARRLYEKDWSVVLVCRQESQCTETISWIKKTASPKPPAGSKAELVAETCDLSSYASCKSFASRYLSSDRPLHALVNNAASSPKQRTESAEGLEIQFAVNILSYFWLTTLLWPRLVATGKKQGEAARVVNVASSYAGGLNLDDIEFKKRRYDNNSGYMASKQANRMITNSFAEKYPEIKAGTVWISACYPAWAPSKLSSDLGSGGPQEASAGAEAPVWAATDPKIARPETAGYWIPRKGSSEPDSYARDKAAMERLWQICVETTKKLEGGNGRGSEL